MPGFPKNLEVLNKELIGDLCLPGQRSGPGQACVACTVCGKACTVQTQTFSEEAWVNCANIQSETCHIRLLCSGGDWTQPASEMNIQYPQLLGFPKTVWLPWKMTNLWLWVTFWTEVGTIHCIQICHLCRGILVLMHPARHKNLIPNAFWGIWYSAWIRGYMWSRSLWSTYFCKGCSGRDSSAYGCWCLPWVGDNRYF